MKLSAIAPAKVNLDLLITGKRADGYHELDSIVVFTENGDEIIVERGDGLSLTIKGRFSDGLDDVENNSILIAARKLQEKYNIQQGAHFTLNKSLPIASGIGGGTSNAATALKLLEQLWHCKPLDDAELLSLGADVPVCYYGQSCQMTSIGEVIKPVNIAQPAYLLLMNPLKAVSTGQIFKSLNIEQGLTRPARTLSEGSLSYVDLKSILSLSENQMQKTAITQLPIISVLIEELLDINPRGVNRMSGSGATCFALFDNEEAAQKAEQIMLNNHKNLWSMVSKIST